MTYLCTYTGRHFDYQNITPDNIHIEDIAHALANIPRFNGHTSYFYSVAQHSLLVSRLVAPEIALDALLHDAAESYLCDIPSPLKKLLPDYQRIEAQVHAAICKKFNISAQTPPAVKHADLIALATEKNWFGIDGVRDWLILRGIKPELEHSLPETTSQHVKEEFINRFYQLMLNKDWPQLRKVKRYKKMNSEFATYMLDQMVEHVSGEWVSIEDFFTLAGYYETLTGQVYIPVRYKPIVHFCGHDGKFDMAADESGEWVKWETYQYLLIQLEPIYHELKTVNAGGGND